MMKKLLCVLFCLVLLPMPGLADDFTAYVDGKTSDRVHLRAKASTQSASLGLFFTGTPVVCYSSLADTWAQVKIGAQTGYMMTEYLKTEDYGVFEMVGTVINIKATTALKVRKTPAADATAVCTVKLGETVQVLGETKDKWCYIRAGEHCGYVKTQYLTQEAVWRVPENTAGAPTIDLQSPYMPVLHQYYIAMLERWSWETLLDHELSEMCESHYESNPHATIGYMLQDMNDNGTPELLIGSLLDGYTGYMLFAMYGLVDQNPKEIIRSWARSRFYLCKDRIIGHEGANGAASGLDALMYLSDNNKLNYIEVTIIEGDYSPETPYWQSNTYEYGHPSGKILTKEEFTANLARYQSLRTQYPLTPFSTLQGTVGRIHYKKNISGSTTVNIRQEPSTAARVLAAPKTGTTLSVLSACDGWYEVYCNGIHGYVMAEFVAVY